MCHGAFKQRILSLLCKFHCVILFAKHFHPPTRIIKRVYLLSCLLKPSAYAKVFVAFILCFDFSIAKQHDDDNDDDGARAVYINRNLMN